MKRRRLFETLTAALLAVLIGAVLAAPAMAQGKGGGKNKDDGGGGDGGGGTDPAAVRYSITLLGTLEDRDRSAANGINYYGDVVGWSRGSGTRDCAYLSTTNPDFGREIIDLNNLLSVKDKGDWHLQYPYGINDDGQIVGTGIFNGKEYTPFRMTPGISDYSIEGLNTDVNPAGINAQGNVTGYRNSWTLAVLVDEHGVHDLGVLRSSDDTSRGTAINAGNHIAGHSGGGGEYRAFLYTPADGMTNLGVIKSGRGGYSQSFAYDINDNSVVVGWSTAGGSKEHAFRWQNGVMEDLGTLGGSRSEGRGVNILGDVVGQSMTSDGTYRNFICLAGSKMVDLQNLVDGLPTGFILSPSPSGSSHPLMRINYHGEIIATGMDVDGKLQSYLLTPQPQTQQ